MDNKYVIVRNYYRGKYLTSVHPVKWGSRRNALTGPRKWALWVIINNPYVDGHFEPI